MISWPGVPWTHCEGVRQQPCSSASNHWKQSDRACPFILRQAANLYKLRKGKAEGRPLTVLPPSNDSVNGYSLDSPIKSHVTQRLAGMSQIRFTKCGWQVGCGWHLMSQSCLSRKSQHSSPKDREEKLRCIQCYCLYRQCSGQVVVFVSWEHLQRIPPGMQCSCS